jgi:hypothetical protein
MLKRCVDVVKKKEYRYENPRGKNRYGRRSE